MKKGKIINFEILWDTDEPIDLLMPRILSKDIIDAFNNGYTTILGIMLNEGILPYDTPIGEVALGKLATLADQLGLEIILISSVGTKFKNIKIPFKIIDFNYHARLVYNVYVNKTHKKIDNNKFLFLGGVPTRSNRIGLLKKFYEQNMLSWMDWSFFPPGYEEDKVWCRNYMGEYSDLEYTNFLKTVNKKFDNVYSEVTHLIHDSEQIHSDEWFKIVDTSFFKSPGYIHESIFNNTSFSIVSEGSNFWTDNYDFITLITWRTLINKHPFIFAGHCDQYEYIKSLGFTTFEKYMLIPNYAYITDEEEKLNAIVKNARHLIENFNAEIYNDACYNYNKYLEIISQQDSMLDDLQNSLNVDNDEIQHYLNQVGISHLVRSPDA